MSWSVCELCNEGGCVHVNLHEGVCDLVCELYMCEVVLGVRVCACELVCVRLC